MTTLYGTREVAELTGRTRISIQKLVERHGIGQKVGRFHVFTFADVETIRNLDGTPGRKAKPKPPKPPSKMGRPRKEKTGQ